MDLVIRNCVIIDGTGAPRTRGDIAIRDGTVVVVGDVQDSGTREIDAQGLAVAPGFIDIHTHYDAQLFWDPMLSPSVFHGVTTVIAGNCGFTLAPLSGQDSDADYLLRMLSRVEGMPLSTLRAVVKPTWTSFGGFLDTVDHKVAINMVFLVGHSALRRTVMGERAVGHGATEQEIEAMCALLANSLAEGGAGFSTTVSPSHSDYEGKPVPSRWATREELIRLASVLRGYPGTWLEMVTGKVNMDEEDYSLMTEVALAADRPLNWNLVTVSTTERDSYQTQLYASDYARERGATVFGLVSAVPPKIIVNFISGFVLDMIPGWMELLTAPLDRRCDMLADPVVRAQLRRGIDSITHPFVRAMFTDWSHLTIESVSLDSNRCWLGRTLGEYASSAAKDPLDAIFDLAVEENLKVSFSPPPLGEDDDSWRLRGEAWQDNRLMIGGSDAGAHLDMINTFALSTQLLGEGVRERGLLSLEDAVHRITGLPARRFGLSNRGVIAPGKVADLVIFDPDSIACGSVEMAFDLPGDESRLTAKALGIKSVIVNGVEVASDGKPTGHLGGRVLRSGRDTHTVAGHLLVQ